jgi:signal transduction histidine kinase
LFSNCDKYCEDHFLTGVGNFPTQWQKTIRPGKPISVAGGQTMQIGKLRAIVEVACIADTEGLIWGVMAHEMLDHLLIPMSLILVVVFGATTFSISSALKPVGRIAQAAMRLDPRKELTDLTATGVPREIKSLIEATNRVLRRSRDLVQSQRVFASAISHEIRTPVSIIQLELEHIDHDRARKALHDLKSLTGTLDILTLLARLDALDSKSFSRFDLTEIGGNTVIDMAPLVYADGKSIAFEHNGPVKVSSVPSLLEIMLRNIVENAVKHTPVGTAIELTVGPGAQVSIVDNPPSTPTTIRPRNIHNPVSHGIGHKIVERIADLLDITVTQSATGTGGTSTVLTLKS